MGSHRPDSETASGGGRLAALRALLCAALAVAAAYPAAASAAPQDEYFGLSAPELYSMSLDGRHDLRDRALEEIERLGVDIVRTEIGWRDVEPRAPLLGVRDYRWQAVDEHVVALAERSQRLMPMLMAPPAWAQPTDSAAACERRGMVDRAHIDDFAAYAAEVARRFGRDGQLWRWAAYWRPDLPQRPITTYEIWNEPNWDAFSCPAIDPEVYAEALAAAADAIHAVDPRARVTVGGLVILERDRREGERLVGMQTARFLERMTAAVPKLGNRVDAVGLHTYWATPVDNLRAISLAEGWLDGVGLGELPLVISEFGWHVAAGPEAVPEPRRAQMVGEYARALAGMDCRLHSVFAHNWITPRANAGDAEDWFGLADPATGAPLASGEAYGAAIAASPQAASASACAGSAEPAPPAPPAPPPAGDLPPEGPAAPPTSPPPAEPPQPGPSEAAAATPASLAITRAPSRTRSRRPAIRFRFSAPGASPDVEARLDRRRWRRVSSPWRLPRLRPGRHVVRLRVSEGRRVLVQRKLRIRIVRPKR